ncbi:TolC family protein [Bdellovibrio sp. HCB288]|uniref:TolC family protein n=1 Tax=Bdellovibrio sp. HCB288 TaxID=3394355 RepID=UPI0039B67E1E
MKTIILSSLLFAVAGAMADQEGLSHQHGFHSECPLPKTSQEIVQCVITHHPKAQKAALGVHQSKALMDKAGQIPNPEVDVEAVFGKGSTSSTDIGLLQPIEWGGKRSSRLKLADSEFLRSDAELKEVQAELILETVQNLYRLTQLEKEKSITSQSIQTFERLVRQQQGRPGLGPEHRVSLSVYKMALAEARMKRSELLDEEKSLEHFFHVATGHSVEELLPALPGSRKKWPEVSDVKTGTETSPLMQKSIAERSYFLAEVSSASAEAWPSLKLGPMAKLEKGPADSENLYGFRLMMDLPVFNLNGGGKSYSQAGYAKAEKAMVLVESEESHERVEQVRIYRAAVAALNEAPTLEEIDKEFANNQKLAGQGLVSSSLVIEFHRQGIELIRSRNSREMKANQALWQIYKYDGRIFQESL